MHKQLYSRFRDPGIVHGCFRSGLALFYQIGYAANLNIGDSV